jgi:hypothetical protein
MEELIIRNRKTKETIVSAINNSGLPAFVLKTILKDCYEQLIKLEDKEYQNAIIKIENDKREKEKEEQKQEEEQEKNNEKEE